MKKILMVLPCLIALGACDKINFYTENIQCLDQVSEKWVYYDSLKVNSKEAILQTADKKIVLKRYTADEYPEFMYYKNEKEEFPLFLHYSKNVYGIGMTVDKLGPCAKVSDNEE